MLRTEGTHVNVSLGIRVEEPKPTIPPEKQKTDYSHEAEEYEKKLIQKKRNSPSRMCLNSKSASGKYVCLCYHCRLRSAYTFAQFEYTSEKSLINVWMPSAFLRGSGTDTYHIYQDSKVVEGRRVVLQTYLRCLINHISEKDSRLSSNSCKQTLLDVLSFFRHVTHINNDKITEKDKKKKKSDGQRTPLSSSPRQAAPIPEQYSGL